MKRARLAGLLAVLVAILLVGCGRNAEIKGTYIHEADDTFGQFTIVHDGNNVSVNINGKDYDAKMGDVNEILVGENNILETFCDAEGNTVDLSDSVAVSILITHPKDWIEGDYAVDSDGNLRLVLQKQ